MSHLTFLATIIIVSSAPAWLLPFIGLTLGATALMSILWITTCRTLKQQQAKVAIAEEVRRMVCEGEEERTEAQQHAHIQQLEALHKDLVALEYTLRGTDEVAEQAYRTHCEETDEDYMLPEFIEGVAEFAVETMVLQQVVLSLHRELVEGRIHMLDCEWYQQRVASLRHRFASWQLQHHARAQLQQCLTRLRLLEQELRCAHGVGSETRASSSPTGSVHAYHKLCDLVVVVRQFLEMKLRSRTADLVQEARQFKGEVDELERKHTALDDALYEDYAVTHRRITREALGVWGTVMTAVRTTALAELQVDAQYHLTQQDEAFARAKRLLATRGACGQHEAVEQVSASLKQWSFGRALQLIMAEAQTPEERQTAYDQFALDVEHMVSSRLQELVQVLKYPEVVLEKSE